MAAYVELILDQGANFNDIITLTDDTTNTSINIVGYSVRSQMRRSYYSANAVNLQCALTDPANGQITISLDAANTANLIPSRYLFDILSTSPGGIPSRVLEGSIIVTPSITR